LKVSIAAVMSFFSKAEPQNVKRRWTGSLDVSAASANAVGIIALTRSVPTEARIKLVFLKAMT
jgi:hypothetical protein